MDRNIVDRQFTEVLSNEIKQEQENMYSCNPPRGFAVAKAEGTDILLKKEYSDGVCVEIGINLAGSINPEMEDVEEEHPASDKKDDAPILEAHPDIRIRLVKPSGRSVVFNCSLPSRDTRSQVESEDSNVRKFIIMYFLPRICEVYS
ncbi:complement component 1 Q subcomponent-binding protein, mitochondrial [Paragonimus westermani]|uniref:Complement component 1 Q subcomponent-binding protein, mitochondrial n=1 Tax=Paragonimus westermani TaxID=34504 RepID=A0A5J4P2A4_9TREM|nr:complement component 1 Q subcomponent-binding protein, mitochondrial [Paragonimus westermani]